MQCNDSGASLPACLPFCQPAFLMSSINGFFPLSFHSIPFRIFIPPEDSTGGLEMNNIDAEPHLHFVFMNYDPEYERLRSDKSKRGAHLLDSYLSKKHDRVLADNLLPGTYNKTISLVIVDGFAVEITDHQANVLRSAKEVRIVEKNQELS